MIESKGLRSWKKGAALAALVIAVGAGEQTVGLESASASEVFHVAYTGGYGVAVRNAPTATAKVQPMIVLQDGTAVTVLCQQLTSDGSTIGVHGNRVMDQILLPVPYAAWIPDAYVDTPTVANQFAPGVPPCGAAASPSTPGQSAANYAAGVLNGQVYASAGDASLFSASDWAPGPYGEWSGDCVKLVSTAWTRATGNANRVPHVGSAIALYRYYANAGAIRGGVPPAGALAFYNITSYGHVALGLGDGRVESTHGLDFARQANSAVSYGAFPNYLGWAMP
jgi:hypothetical protein